ncbi:MAG: nuclear transport factor 2 family protein [Bacteroidota bacterium]
MLQPLPVPFFLPRPCHLSHTIRPVRWGLAFALVWSTSAVTHAQQTHEGPDANPATSGPLYDELARMDSLVFAASFVACDFDAANALFTDDVEFYHDLTGASYGEAVRDDFRRLTASCPRENGVTRELIEGTLEVYPMQDYGAIQMGLHRFTERGAPTSTIAQFVHLWQRQPDGTWKISRVLSFDHRPESVSTLEEDG